MYIYTHTYIHTYIYTHSHIRTYTHTCIYIHLQIITTSAGDPDRDKIVMAYEAIRPNIQTRVDLECFLCYFGPKGRLAGGRRAETGKGGLSILLSLIK